MFLLVDAGNTRIKWALVARPATDALGQWQASGSIASSQADQLADAWHSLGVRRVLISNVAGSAVRTSLEQSLHAADEALKPEWFASVPMLAGVCNGYRNPAQLGCDRFASAIGAYALFPGEPLVVATCGTATTIDALSPDGVFLGGMILPGLGLMASSLARNTAQLPQVGQDVAVLKPFADNTDAAIVSGCIAAQSGAIERAVALHTRASTGNSNAGNSGEVRCILAGGAASIIAPHLWVPCTPVDNLVLVGLHAVVRHAALAAS